ncbi:MAG: hypothetical protein JXB38_06975 [Anaerolineales bacterium]|nr:hypothetical protein [Anaerolineales bacterium]
METAILPTVTATAIPSASPTLTPTELQTETPTLTEFPTKVSLPTHKPTQTPKPAPILINPSAKIDKETILDLELLRTVDTDSDLDSVIFSQDGTLFAAVPRSGEEIKLIRVATLEEMRTSVIVDSSTELFSSITNQFSVLEYQSNFEVSVKDLSSGKLLSLFGGHLLFIKTAISNDGRLIAVGSAPSESYPRATENIIIWDWDKRERIQTLYGDWYFEDDFLLIELPAAAFFSPDTALLAATTLTERSIIWDVASGERVKEIENVWLLGFSHDGTKLAAGVNKYLIAVYDTASWKLVNAPMNAPGEIDSIIFTPDDDLLIISTKTGTVMIWDWKTGELVREISSSGTGLLLSPDGKLLLSYYRYNREGGNIFIWGVP